MDRGLKWIAGAMLVLSMPACGEQAEPSANVADGRPAVASANAQATAAPPAQVEARPFAPALTAAGYDGIRIGTTPADARGYGLIDDGSYEDSCRIFTSPRLNHVYAIVENGRIMRLTAFHRPGSGSATIRTDRGIGVGATEAEVRAAYTPLREQPHHYVEAPAKDLFFGGSEREPGLRFEMGNDGRVTAIHAGLMPVLGYVESCS